MPNFEELVLWGVPLLGLVGGVMAFLRWAVPTLDEKLDKVIGGLLVAIGVFFISALPDLVVTYPWLEVWGSRVLWAITGMLFYTGHYPLLNRVNINRLSARVLK